MGCDGGTIPRRDELVKVKKKPETRDADSHLIFRWKYCNLTQQHLQPPVVTCGLGKLYNKTSIIEGLINKETPPHIRTLRDVRQLNLTPNAEYREEQRSQADASPYICPLTGLEMSGRFKFFALWLCGCVFSERGFKMVGGESCPNCQKVYTPADLIVLNPDEDDEVRLRDNLRQNRRHRR